MTQWLAVIIDFDAASSEPGTFDQWSADWAVVVFSVLGLVLAMLILMWVYTSMQHPRLYLTADADGRPGTTVKSAVRYLVLTPIMVGVWYFVIALILSVATTSRTPEQIAVLSAAVIGAARVLAHITADGSHELGKTLPLAVLSIILIGGSQPTPDEWMNTMIDLANNVDQIDTYYYILVALDFVMTALWFAEKRWHWLGLQKGSNRSKIRAAALPFTNFLRNIRDFGKTQDGKPIPSHSGGTNARRT